MKLRAQSKKRVRIWRGTRQAVRPFPGDAALLPPAELIAQALREVEEKVRQGDGRWANRDRSKPANPWSGKP